MQNTQNTITDEENKENSLFHFHNNSFTFQSFSIALSSFYRKTNISGQISFSYVIEEDSVMINVGFSKVPSEEEYFIFLEDLKIAERFVVANSFLSYTEDLLDFDELDELKEKFSKELKASSIYLDINLNVESK